MIKYIVTLILILLIIYFGIDLCIEKKESFTVLPILDSSPFVHLYDNTGTKLNISLISKPFGTDSDYKLFLNNINKYIFIGITSYMEFPSIPGNPIDKYILEKDVTESTVNQSYNLEMYFKLCDGWLHCFREPIKYLPHDKPSTLISESDFVNYNVLKPDTNIKKEYDFIYSCPKVDKNSPCNDWVSLNKNWELALKCFPIMCLKYKLKGLLIGREGCELPEGCEPYLDTTGWLDYNENIKLYNKCKFIFVPNVRDASPRILTEALASNLPALVNINILGGWKYIESGKTGEFFTDENDISQALDTLLLNMNKYEPREYIINNYGPINSGKRLKKFIFDNFKDQVKNDKNEIIDENSIEYIVFRGPLVNFIP